MNVESISAVDKVGLHQAYCAQAGGVPVSDKNLQLDFEAKVTGGESVLYAKLESGGDVYRGSLERLKDLAAKGAENVQRVGDQNGEPSSLARALANSIGNFREEMAQLSQKSSNLSSDPREILRVQLDIANATVTLQFLSKLASTFSQDIQTLFKAQ